MKRFLLIAAAVLFACASHADQVNLAWDANSEPNLSGYRIYVGESPGNWSGSVNVGKVTAYSFQSVAPPVYFGATALGNCEDDQKQLYECESGFSNIVYYSGPVLLQPATNLQAAQNCGIGDQMDVEKIGTVVYQQNQTGGSLSINIETDAEIIVFFISGYNGSSGNQELMGKINFDNEADIVFNKIVVSMWSTYEEMIAYYIHKKDTNGDDNPNWPGTGAKTIYWATDGFTCTEGANVSAVQFKNVDYDGTIIDTASANYTSQHYQELTLDGVGANDLSIIAGGQYNAVVDSDPTGYGQTAIYEGEVAHYNAHSVGAELGEDVLRIESPGNYLCTIAFALKASSASASSVLPMAANLYRQMR